MSNMLMSRADAGCTLNAHTQEIYVIGGYSQENQNNTKHCERYSIKDDYWKPLPKLNEKKK